MLRVQYKYDDMYAYCFDTSTAKFLVLYRIVVFPGALWSKGLPLCLFFSNSSHDS